MKRSLSLLLMVVLLAGCQTAPESAVSPAPTAIRPTSSPAPRALPAPSLTPPPILQEREWTPKPVLLRLDLIRKAEEILNPPAPPQFMLYADGSAFLVRPAIAGVPHGDQQLLFKKMERAEMCRLLNALDQAGFLDYDPSTYSGESGLYDAYFEVNAWKSHKGIYAELPLKIFNERMGVPNDAEVSPALMSAYALAMEYPADGFEPYPPKALGVWIRPLKPEERPNLAWKDWTFPALSLSYLYSKIEDGEGYAILRKQGAANLYEYLKESFSVQYYVETNRLGEKSYYAAYARPLLPHEIPGGMESEATPPAESKLKCLPSDGAMEIPQPRWIYTLPIP